MKEINYHNSNLLSFAPIDLTFWKDRIIFNKLIETLSKTNKSFYFMGQRPENGFTVENINDMNIIYHNKKYSDVILSSSKSSNLYADNLMLCCEYWNKYEQATFLFSNSLDVILNKKHLRKSWEDLVSLTDPFILFKGIEEYVIWIGKTESINFPDIGELKYFNPNLG